MSRHRRVPCARWNNAAFRGFSDDAKLAYFFIETFQNMTALGAMRATVDGLARELGWPTRRFRQAIVELSAAGWIRVDERGCLVYAPRFLSDNKPESPNVVKAWAASLELLPECQLKAEILASAKAFTQGLGEGFQQAFHKVFQQAFAKGMANKDQEAGGRRQEKDLPPTPQGVDEARVARCLQRFAEICEETTGAPYPRNDARDWKHAERLCITYAIDRDYETIFRRYFNEPSRDRRGFSLGRCLDVASLLGAEIVRDAVGVSRLTADDPAKTMPGACSVA